MEEPQPQYTQFYREEGPYDWIDQSHIVAKYVFIYPEDVDLETEFTVDLEYDEWHDQTKIAPVDLARWIAHTYKTRYLSHAHQKNIDAVVSYLQNRRQKDKEELKQYEIAYAQYQVEYWTTRLRQVREKHTRDKP
jgi:hypothetical protein